MTPLFPDVGVLGLVPDTWQRTVWQLRHNVLTRLSRYFHVVWVDPPRGWRAAWFGREAAPEDLNGVRVSDSFEVYRHGPLLPQVFRPMAVGALLRHARWRAARRMLSRKGVTSVVLYLWRPEFVDALDDVKYDASVYHVDDEYSFSLTEQVVSSDELTALRRADQVIIHSRELFQKKGAYNPETILVPNGVDFAAYTAPRSEPDDLTPIPHPRIGYVGTLKNQLDWALLAGLADRNRDWSFVYVGPIGVMGDAQALFDRLASRRNVYVLGRKSVNDLPAYTQYLDVCMMPYSVNDYTRYIFPLKLNEYLACGKPVIGSPIPTLLEFEGVVRIASGISEWSDAVAELLRPPSTSRQRVVERQAIAKSHDWNVIVTRIGRAICEKLGPDYVVRFDSFLAADASAGSANRPVTAG